MTANLCLIISVIRCVRPEDWRREVDKNLGFFVGFKLNFRRKLTKIILNQFLV